MARKSRRKTLDITTMTYTDDSPDKLIINKTAVYARLSIADNRLENGDSLDNQIEYIKNALAGFSDINIVETYSDNGFSGTNFNRNGWENLINDVKSGKINCIAVKDLSRLGRNSIEAGNYLEKIFPFMNVRFISINDNYDSNYNDYNKSMVENAFKNLMNEFYAKGMSQRDIESTLREIYGSEISEGLISRITDKILPEVNERQNRPLNRIYPVIFFDGIIFNSRKDNRIINKCVYSVLGINMDDGKEILGMWISENKTASFYASICSDLKNRGDKDIFIACHDNLTGLCEAIKSIFPKTKNQLCIVHQVRNSCKFVPYKDRKAVCADLKKIYTAVNLDDAEYAKEEFREKWDKKYPNILKSWDKNREELTAYFEYPAEIRKIIYTTNAVEGYHRMVRKFTKSKSIFPTDDTIRKVIYMSVKEISKKWTKPVRNGGLAYAQFMVYFEDRFAA